MRKTLRKATQAKIQISCDFCGNVLDTGVFPYGPISISFPFGHSLDSCDSDTDICSDECAIKFFEKVMLEHNAFQHPLKKN